jgi:hypothetical protein
MYYFHKPCLFVALVLLASACKKEQSELEKLPDATQNGANTAGCLIDGKAFVATGWGSGMSKVPGVAGGFYVDTIYWLRLNGVYDNRNTSLSLFLRNGHKPGRYELNTTTPIVPQAGMLQARNHAAFTIIDTGETFATSSDATGFIQIDMASLPTSSAGTFEFSAASLTEPGKVIRVTNGRFDVRN